MSARPDVVVIGSGVNGLTAAAFLARAGRNVLVLEQTDRVGGTAAAEEFHPGHHTAGLLHDTTGVRPAVVDALELEREGLELASGPPPVFAPRPGGSGLLLHHGPDEAAEELGRFSARDVNAYRAFRAFLAEIRGVVRRILDEAPPELTAPGVKETWPLLTRAASLRRLGGKDMMELLRTGPMCVADWLDERFETDLLKAALALPAVESTFAGPRSPGTAVNMVLRECAAGGCVLGGPAALARALEASARRRGVEIRTGAEVERVLISGGAVRGVRLRGGEEIPVGQVGASCDPRRTFLDLMAGPDIPSRLEHEIRNLRGQGLTARMDLALTGPLEFAGRPGETFAFVRVGETLDALEQAFDPAKYGELPGNPTLDIHVPTVHAPGLAPPGHAVVSILARSVPYRLAGGWTDAAREELGDRIVRRLAAFAPELPGRLIARRVLTPADLEARYGLVEGHLHHGDHALDQLLVRPTPECARYLTPIEGLFLCGAGSHPGGGVTCAPGALAARTAIRHPRLPINR